MAFLLRGTEASGSPDGKLKTFHVDVAHAGVLGVGDAVVLTGTAHTDGVPEVDVGVANTRCTGIIQGVTPNYAGEALSSTHLAASTAGTVLVNVDSDALYDVPVSNGPLVADNVGLNAPIVATVGTVNGSMFTSNMGVNATGVATTVTLPLTIVKLLEDDAGTLGERALVRLNATTSAAGSVGT